jgi:thymidylate kinase
MFSLRPGVNALGISMKLMSSAADQVMPRTFSGEQITSTSPETQYTPLSRVVAIVGCDGSGKTSLVTDLVARLNTQEPTERCYMGLVSGETGDKIKKLPIIGKQLERYLAARVRRAQDMKEKVPGLFSACVMYGFSLLRVSHLRRLMKRSESGHLTIADRYPQAEFSGFHYDGPGIDAGRTESPFIQKLAKREQKLYDWMAKQRPALIIRLNVDADTAHARKSDHPLEELREKTAIMPRIKYNGTRILEIDARLPYEQVLQTALNAIKGAVSVGNLSLNKERHIF